MSAETRQAVEDALAAHMADENDGAYMSGYLLMIAGVRADDPTITTYSSMVPRDQHVHSSIGLATMLADTGRYLEA